MYINYNPHPYHRNVGDCVIRALSKVTGDSWDDVYLDLAVMYGFNLKDMPSANYVWGAYLRNHGFQRKVIPDSCPDCYRVDDFCTDHPEGTYVLGTGSHVVAVVDGNYYDSWDSGDEVPIYYYQKGVR